MNQRQQSETTNENVVRAGKETGKRNLILVDDTCTEITLSLWGDMGQADPAQWEGNPVVAFKGIKVSLMPSITTQKIKNANS